MKGAMNPEIDAIATLHEDYIYITAGPEANVPMSTI